MGSYTQATATVISCERKDTVVYTIVDIEPFDDKNILTRIPRAPASLILKDCEGIVWRFDLHKLLSIIEKQISFISYEPLDRIPIVGQKYTFQIWWGIDQLYLAQSDTSEWKKKKFISPHPKWGHEHCRICWERLSEYEGEQHIGYVRLDEKGQEDWLCGKCYEEYVISGFGKKLGEAIG